VIADPDRPQLPWHLVVVAAFALLLVAQGYLSFAAKHEPYPTVRMPSFGPAASRDGVVRLTFARLEATGQDGSTRVIAVSALMDEFRFSAARPSYDHLFQGVDPSKLSPRVLAWLRERIEFLTRDFRPVEARLCWQPSEVSVVDASVVRDEPCRWTVVAL
jgi:hypothetical protein